MKKESNFRDEVNAGLQEIIQDKTSKAMKYDKMLNLYKKLNGVLTIFDQWEKDLQMKERALTEARYESEKPSRNVEALNNFMNKMESVENLTKKTFLDILAQKNEIKNQERLMKQRENTLIQKETDFFEWEEKLKLQEKTNGRTAGVKAQQTEFFKGETEKIEKLKAELETKSLGLMKQELILSQREQNLVDKDKELQDKEKQYNQREKTLTTREGLLATKEERLELKDQELKDRQSELRQMEVLFGEREALFAEKEAKFAEKEQVHNFKEQTTKEKEHQQMEKEQKLLEKEIELSDKETELANNKKKQEDRFDQMKKSLESKEQTLVKLKESVLEEKLQVQSLTQNNLDQLKQKELELLKREKELANVKESRNRSNSSLAFEQKLKKGVDPEMLEAYRKEVEKAFMYTKTDIKRVTAEYAKKEKLDNQNDTGDKESESHAKAKQILAFDWFKTQLSDKIGQFEQFLTGRMLEIQSFLDPESITKTSINKEQFKLEILEAKSEERKELEELKRTLAEQEKEMLKKEEFFKRREADILSKAWKIKNMVKKLNLNIRENTIKNMHEAEMQQSIEMDYDDKKSEAGDSQKLVDTTKLLIPSLTKNSSIGTANESSPKQE